jgi:phosphotriesterase-related protein
MGHVELTGKAQTVLGLVDADSLGVTLPHEHILIGGAGLFIEPSEAGEKILDHQTISLENIDWVRKHFRNNLDNMTMPDEQVLIKELMFYKMAGGDTIVELTCTSTLGRDPLGLVRIARATGVNIIMSTGFYEVYAEGVSGVSPGYETSSIAARSEEDLAEEMVREIMVGAGNTGVRAGIIGEIGTAWPLSDTQRKFLRASARAQRRTGAAINIHPSLKTPSPKDHEDFIMEVVNVLGDADADLSRTVISHIDMCCLTLGFRCKLAETGVYLEYDVFGWEGYPPRDIELADVPNDAQRVNEIIQLIGEGYLNQILIAGDHCVKIMLRSYGGWGYDHILTNVVPLMRYKGMSDEQIHTLLVENPKRLLSFAPVKE